MPGLTADESAAFALMKEADDKPILVDDDSQPEAEEAEVEAAVEEDEQPAPQPEKVEKPRKYVPHEALHAEREERKKAEAETLRLSQQMAALNERIRLSQQMAEQESTRAQEKIPTSLEDPIAVLQRLEQKERDAERQRADEEHRRASFNAFAQHYKSQVDLFKATDDGKDFDDAYKFLNEKRAAFHMMTGVPQHAIKQVIENEEANLVGQAMTQGQNPGAKLVELARFYGWNGKQAEAAPAASPQAGPDAAKRLDKIATTQQRNASLSSAGGAAPPAAIGVGVQR
jgi:hypothetical protein